MRNNKEIKGKAVIFDLDGTLVDTLEDICDSVNHVLKMYNCPPHPIEKYRTFIGNGAPTLIERVLPEERREELKI